LLHVFDPMIWLAYMVSYLVVSLALWRIYLLESKVKVMLAYPWCTLRDSLWSNYAILVGDGQLFDDLIENAWSLK